MATNWLHQARQQQALFQAYLECLLLDRERLDDLLQKQQSYEQARLTAVKLIDNLLLHPMLSNVPPPAAAEQLSAYDLAVYLDFLQRVLGNLAKKEDDNFGFQLQQELTYLLPRLWQPLQNADQQLKELKERILHFARLYGNQFLLDELDLGDKKTRKSYDNLLRVVDKSLASAWPKQLAWMIGLNEQLATHIQRLIQIPGLEWSTMPDIRKALQGGGYQSPSLILVDLSEPTQNLNRLLKAHPQATVIALVEKLSNLQPEQLPERVDHLLEYQWLQRFLPTLIRQHLLQRWRDTHQRQEDYLTGLSSLLGLRQQFEHLQDLFARIKMPFTFVLLDLPELARIEKEEGPYLASQWVKSVARSLGVYLRGSDWIARWAPDKFVLLLSQTSIQGAIVAIDRCQERLKREAPIPGNIQTQAPLIRAGVVTIKPKQGFEDVLYLAHQQLRKSWEENASAVQYEVDEFKAPSSLHILLIDDDPIMQDMLKFMFAREGYQITQLTTGQGVLDVLEKDPVSLVILDVKLPGMDGFEVLRTIRSHREYDHLPVVMLSSMKSEEDVAQGFDQGADDYLYKPFSPTELMIRVRRFLK